MEYLQIVNGEDFDNKIISVQMGRIICTVQEEHMPTPFICESAFDFSQIPNENGIKFNTIILDATNGNKATIHFSRLLMSDDKFSRIDAFQYEFQSQPILMQR